MEIAKIDQIMNEIRDTLNQISKQIVKPDEKKINEIWEKIAKIESMLEQKEVETKEKSRRGRKKQLEKIKQDFFDILEIKSYFDEDE